MSLLTLSFILSMYVIYTCVHFCLIRNIRLNSISYLFFLKLVLHEVTEWDFLRFISYSQQCFLRREMKSFLVRTWFLRTGQEKRRHRYLMRIQYVYISAQNILFNNAKRMKEIFFEILKVKYLCKDKK